jgi:hypothetical protein
LLGAAASYSLGAMGFLSNVWTLKTFFDDRNRQAEETDQALMQRLLGTRTSPIALMPAQHHPFKSLRDIDDLYPMEAECCRAYIDRFTITNPYIERRVNGFLDLQDEYNVILFGSQVSNLATREILGNPYGVVDRVEYHDRNGGIVGTIPLRWNLREDENSPIRTRLQYGGDWQYHDYVLHDFRSKGDIQLDDPNSEDLLLITALPRYRVGDTRRICLFGLHAAGTLASSKLLLQPPIDALRVISNEIRNKLAYQAYQALFRVSVDRNPQTGELQPASLTLKDVQNLYWKNEVTREIRLDPLWT